MQLQLTKPHLEKFIADKVEAGEFPSPEAVVEDAVTRMMEQEHSLTDEDVKAINAAEEEIDRGDFVDFDVFAAEMRRKHGAT